MTTSAVMRSSSRSSVARALRDAIPSAGEASLVVGSALLTVLAFPDFKLWFLAWISLAPFLIVINKSRTASRAFVSGWLWGVIFFYGTCWWLTYPMIHFAGISAWLAYPLLLFPVILGALFPALFAGLLARVVQRSGDFALLLAPLIWVSTELLRYAATGQLWNALGYSQAFHPWLIQTARWGGVYATSSTLVLASSGIAMLLVRHDRRRFLLSAGTILIVTVIVGISAALSGALRSSDSANLLVQAVAVQPNVPMDGLGSSSEMNALLQRHLDLSLQGLREVPDDVGKTVLVIWPESPMNFTYSGDPKLQQVRSEERRV